MHGQRYTNCVLTAIGGILALHLVGHFHDRGMDVGPGISVAQAAQPESYRRDSSAGDRPMGPMDPSEGGLISAAEQRKIMIAELRNLGARLAAIESKLGTGISVSVTDMPAINWPAQAAATPETSPVEPTPSGNP